MKTLLVFATNSGNTAYAADLIAATFARHRQPLELRNVGYVEPDEVLAYDVVILGSCTWEKKVKGQRLEGQLQDQMEAFLSRVALGLSPGHRFALFGLGDADFRYFCGAAVLLERWLESVRGVKVGPTLYVDGFPQTKEGDIIAWAEMLIAAIRAPESALPHAEQAKYLATDV